MPRTPEPEDRTSFRQISLEHKYPRETNPLVYTDEGLFEGWERALQKLREQRSREKSSSPSPQPNSSDT